MKIAVINESFPTYNLACQKMAAEFRRQGHEVFLSPRADMWSKQSQKAYISVIFTDDLPKAVEDINNLRAAGVEVEVGGPAATVMPEYITENTGVVPHRGLDDRFEFIKGCFKMTFSSRGCIRKCPWCIVKTVEPTRVEYDDFPLPAGENPYLGDNCILATSEAHQRLVVEKLKDVRNLDINSGFDCRLFTEDSYQLFSKLHLEAWRLAFDSMGVEEEFTRAVGILKKHDIGYRKILVYNLIGFPGTTFEECVYRLEKTRSLGCSPYPQKYAPLDNVNARDYVAPGFEKEKLDMLRSYWCSPFTWRTCSWEDYKKRYKPENAGQLGLEVK